MPSRSSSNRKLPPRKASGRSNAKQQHPNFEPETPLHDEEHEHGFFAERTTQLREMTRGHEGSVVVTALVTGFSIGLFIGGLLVHSKSRSSPSDHRFRDLGRRFYNQLESHVPESVRNKVGLG